MDEVVEVELSKWSIGAGVRWSCWSRRGGVLESHVPVAPFESVATTTYVPVTHDEVPPTDVV